MRPLEIAIIGAGPAGLAAALYLHRAGHRVTVFERFEEAKPVGSGLILQPTGLTILDDLGLYEEMAGLGARIDKLYGLDASTGRPVLDVRYSALPGSRFGVAVHRAALFGVLMRAARAEGIAVETGHVISGYNPSSRSASLLLESGKRLGAFELVVDASGARSQLKMATPGAREPKALPYGAFWATLKWTGAPFDRHALAQRYRRAAVMIGVLPIGKPDIAANDSVAFFWSLKPDSAPQVVSAGLAAWKGRVAALWPECQPLLDQIDSFEQMSLARYGHHTLSLPISRRLAVIGDAAHSTSPQLGQGANMALLDARAFAYALEKNSSLDAALDAYAAARRWHVRGFQSLSWMFTPFYQSDSAFLPLARDYVAPSIASLPVASRALAMMVSGTLIDPYARLGLTERQWPDGCRPPEQLAAARA